MTEDVLLSTKGASLKGSIEVKKMELEDAFAGFEPVTSESETVDIGEVNKGEEEASKIVVWCSKGRRSYWSGNEKILALAALNQEENAVEEITESTNSDEVKKREIEAIGSY